MAYEFNRALNKDNIHHTMLTNLGMNLTTDDHRRLSVYRTNWNFYEGFHWEDLQQDSESQVTENYCRAFVDRFVGFEFGDGFTVKMDPEIENIQDAEGTTTNPLEFINDVWNYNGRQNKLIELGQMKAVTGDVWVGISFTPADELQDPFGYFDRGKVDISILPSSICFPEYSDYHNRDQMTKFTIMYPVENPNPMEPEERGMMSNFLNPRRKQKDANRVVNYVMEYTRKTVRIWLDGELKETVPNKYGTIPFVQIKNVPLAGQNFGSSDLEDIIPLNVELNLKKSNISDIIDYHAAPITAIFGARVGQLERGANKLWGGLPKDSRIENLRLDGDLVAANNYISELKDTLSHIGNVPKTALGGEANISNTSGVALHFMLMPLLERIKVKRGLSQEGVEKLNKLILLVGEKEGLITVPTGFPRWKFFHNNVTFGDILPKDPIMELQKIQSEMTLGLEDRRGAMERTGKQDIEEKIGKVDAERETHPEIYGLPNVEREKEMLLFNAELQRKNMEAQAAQAAKLPQSTKTQADKPVGTNKEGKPKQINSGVTNGPEKKK